MCVFGKHIISWCNRQCKLQLTSHNSMKITPNLPRHECGHWNKKNNCLLYTMCTFIQDMIFSSIFEFFLISFLICFLISFWCFFWYVFFFWFSLCFNYPIDLFSIFRFYISRLTGLLTSEILMSVRKFSRVL